MICKECSTEFEGSFCPVCGTAGKAQQTSNDNFYQSGSDDSFYHTSSGGSYDDEPPKKSNGLMIALIAIGAVIVIGIFAVIGLLLKDKKGEGTALTEQTTTAQTAEAIESADEEEPETTVGKVDYSGGGVDYSQPTNNVVEPDFLYNDSTLYVSPSVGLILRSGPSENYAKILTIPFSQAVTVKGGCSSASKWIYVNYSGYSGWVHSDYLSSTKPKANYTPSTTKRINSYYDTNEYFSYSYSYTATVTPSKGLNLRSGATTSSYSYVVLPKGTKVTVLGYSAYDSSWVYCYAYVNGAYYYGFVSSAYIR